MCKCYIYIYIDKLYLYNIYTHIYTHKYILTFYPATSLNSGSCSCFLIDSLAFSRYTILTSYFLTNFYNFSFFSCHITQIRTLSRVSRILNRSGERGYLSLIPNLMRKAFNILPSRILFSEGFTLMSFISLRKSLLFLGFWELFS